MARIHSSFRTVKPFVKYVLLAISVSLCVGLGQASNVRCTGAINCSSWMQPPCVVASTVENLPNLTGLVQEGKDFYDREQFAEAARVWQQALQAFQAQEDELNQAIALSFLSLAYQRLGQWDEAGNAIASSLQLLRDAGL